MKSLIDKLAKISNLVVGLGVSSVAAESSFLELLLFTLII